MSRETKARKYSVIPSLIEDSEVTPKMFSQLRRQVPSTGINIHMGSEGDPWLGETLVSVIADEGRECGTIELKIGPRSLGTEVTIFARVEEIDGLVDDIYHTWRAARGDVPKPRGGE
tara:strand:+ start:377 stop:727 length:351 start_codon:yes stop_codon:yes gene_type:complete